MTRTETKQLANIAESSTGRIVGRSTHAASMRPPLEGDEDSERLVSPIDIASSAERTRLSLPDDLTLASWCRIGSQILRLSDSSSWWIGDWLVFGQDKYRNRYKRAMAETSLDYQTLRNYAWVARRFSPARRRAKLTFQHHMEVAALSEEEQDHWLDFALRLGWSRNELRKQVRNSVDGGSEEEGADAVRLQLQISAERMQRWESEAARLNCSLTDWMTDVLDQATTA